MTNETSNRSKHSVRASIRGFAAFPPVLRNNMTILKVGVQVNPRKRDYYDVLLFGRRRATRRRPCRRGPSLRSRAASTTPWRGAETAR